MNAAAVRFSYENQSLLAFLDASTGKWSVPLQPDFDELLNAMASRLKTGPKDPNPWRKCAELAAEVLDGTIEYVTPPELPEIPGPGPEIH